MDRYLTGFMVVGNELDASRMVNGTGRAHWSSSRAWTSAGIQLKLLQEIDC
jgi:hypothetical protein